MFPFHTKLLDETFIQSCNCDSPYTRGSREGRSPDKIFDIAP